MLSCTKKPKKTNQLKKKKSIDIKSISGPVDLEPNRKQIKSFVPRTTKGGVVLTARSLLLNQEVSCFAALRGNPAHWLSGSLVNALGLSPKDLEAFKGKTVLDLAGGASIVAEELVEAFGAKKVIVVDLFHDEYQDRMREVYSPKSCKCKKTCKCKKHREAAVEIYVENLKVLKDLIPAGEDQWEEVHQTLVEKSDAIAKVYFKKKDCKSVSRMKGDATDMSAAVKDSSVDVVLNTWMLMYMSPEARAAAIKEMVRVTKPGGRIRIVGGDVTCSGGYGSSKKTGEKKELKGDNKLAFSTKLLKEWFPGYDGTKNTHFDGKYIKINTALSKKVSKKGSLMVLDVKKAKKSKSK